MSVLTREQVEKTLCRFGVDLRAEWRDDWKAIADTDAALRQQLAETMQHLEAQRLATYQAVEREHAVKQENARLLFLLTKLERRRRANQPI